MALEPVRINRTEQAFDKAKSPSSAITIEQKRLGQVSQAIGDFHTDAGSSQISEYAIGLEIAAQHETATVKTQSKVFGFFSSIAGSGSWATTKVYQLTTWGTAQIVKSAFFQKNGLEKDYEKSLSELEEISKGPEFGLFLTQICDPLARVINKQAFSPGFMKEVLHHEEKFLSDLLRVIIPKMALGIAKDLQQQKSEAENITPVDILLHLSNKITPHLGSLQEELVRAENLVDLNEKKKARNAAVAPLVDELVLLCFPKGAENLPLRKGMREIVWKRLKNQILPSFVIEYAGYLKGMQSTENLEAFKAEPKNAFLVDLTHRAGNFAQSWGAEWIRDPKVSAALADHMMKQLTDGGDLDFSVSSSQKLWLTDQIQKLGAIEKESIAGFWLFLGSSVETLLTHVAVKMSQNHSGQDAFMAIYLKFMEILERHQTSNAKSINLKDSELSSQQIALFVPLAKDLQVAMGLVPHQQAVPGFLKQMVDKGFTKYLPRFLANHYEKLFLPLIELNQMVQNFESSKDLNALEMTVNPKLKEQCAVTVHQFVARIPNLCVDYAYNITTSIRNQFLKKLPKLKENLGNILLSSIQGPPALLENSENINFDAELSDNFSFDWLAVKFQGLNSSHPRIQKMWSFIETHFTNLLTHMAQHAFQDSSQDVKIILSESTLNCFFDFNKMYGQKISEHFCLLAAQGISPEDDLEFCGYFKILCQDLWNQFDFNNPDVPLPDSIVKLFHSFFFENVPKLLAQQYGECFEPHKYLDIYSQRLSSLISDESPEMIQGAQQVENLLGFFAGKIAQASKIKLLEKAEGFFGAKLKVFENPQVQEFQDQYLKKVIHSLLLQGVVHYLERHKQAGANFSGASLSEILNPLVVMLERHLKACSLAVQEAESAKDSKDKKKLLRHAFQPLATDLINLIKPLNVSSDQKAPLTFPFPGSMEIFWPDIEKSLLPDLLGEIYQDMSLWIEQLSQQQEKLKTRMGSQRLPEACDALSRWITDFIPPFLFRERDDLAKSVYSAIQNHLKKYGTEESISIQNYLERNDILIKQKLCEEIFGAFSRESATSNFFKPSTKLYLEAILLKVFNGITERTDELENPGSSAYQKDFFVNLGIRLLNTVKDHFHTINRVTAQQNKYAAHRVPHEIFVREFIQENKLHAGVPQTPQALQNYRKKKEALKLIRDKTVELQKLTDPLRIEKNKLSIAKARNKLSKIKKSESKEREKFFKPLSEYLIQLSGIKNVDDLPFPSPLKEELYEAVKNKLLPAVFINLYQKVLNPNTRALMVITGLESLNEALDHIDEGIEEFIIPQDETQRQLNQACGELVLQLVELVPKSMIKAAFKIDRIQTLSAEKVGHAVRRQLSNKWKTILNVVDKGIASGVSGITRGKDFPETIEEIEAEELKHLEATEKNLKKMHTLLVKTGHSIMSKSIVNSLKAPAIRFKQLWDLAVDKVFGKYADNVREFFKYIGSTIVFRVVEIIFDAASFPVRYSFWFFMDIHLGIKANHIVNSLQLDIHENLLYTLSDELMETLKGNRGIDTENLIKPLLLSAALRDAEEIESVNDYLRGLGLDLLIPQIEEADTDHSVSAS